MEKSLPSLYTLLEPLCNGINIISVTFFDSNRKQLLRYFLRYTHFAYPQFPVPVSHFILKNITAN